MPLDEELLELSELALSNAFYEEYSELVNKYLAAGEELGDLLNRMAVLSNPYSRRDKEPTESIDLWVQHEKPEGSTWHHTFSAGTISEALSDEDAIEVWLNGAKVFEKEDGEWRYVEVWDK